MAFMATASRLNRKERKREIITVLVKAAPPMWVPRNAMPCITKKSTPDLSTVTTPYHEIKETKRSVESPKGGSTEGTISM